MKFDINRLKNELGQMKMDFFKKRVNEDKEREESKNKLNQVQEEVKPISLEITK